MRDLRSAVLCFIVASILSPSANAQCGCASTHKPCEQESLVSAAAARDVPAELSLTTTDESSPNFGAIGIAFLLLPIVLVLRRDRLIVLRLDLLSVERQDNVEEALPEAA